MTIPTPLKTILTPDRYSFAVAYADDGKIKCTSAYASSLEEVYFMVQGWNNSLPQHCTGRYIMAEMRDLDETPSYSYWVAV